MKRPVLVVVEMDEAYLMPLEMKLAFSAGDKVKIEFISSREEFQKYFSKLRNIDILVIDENIYGVELQRHNIKRTYILTENSRDDFQEGRSNPAEVRIFKYSNLNTLSGMILPDEWTRNNGNESKGQILAVLSPAGGAGCTTVAVGVAGFLANKQRSVLYMNTQQLQSFQYFFNSRKTLPVEAAVKIKSGQNLYSNLKCFLAKEYFDYLPELSSTQKNLNVEMHAYSQLAAQAAESHDYDFVVVDIGAELHLGEWDILEKADKILVVVNQDAYSEYKVSMLDRFLNYGDQERFVFVCNKFNPEEINYFGKTGTVCRASKVIVDEYIETVKIPYTIDQLSVVKGIQNVGMLMF